jgi:hypothetical protein
MLFPLLRNQSAANLQLQQLDVSVSIDSRFGVSPATLPSELLSFAVGMSATVPAGGFRALSATVIKAELAGKLSVSAGERYTITVSVVAVADREGVEVRSQRFRYVVEVCQGCLVTLLAACPEPGAVELPDNPCGMPQDQPVACCDDAKRGRVCLPSDS